MPPSDYEESMKKNIVALTVIALIINWAGIAVKVACGAALWAVDAQRLTAVFFALAAIHVIPNFLFCVGLYLKNDRLLLPLILVTNIFSYFYFILAIIGSAFYIGIVVTEWTDKIDVATGLCVSVGVLVWAGVCYLIAYILNKSRNYVKADSSLKTKPQPKTESVPPSVGEGMNALSRGRPVYIPKASGWAANQP